MNRSFVGLFAILALIACVSALTIQNLSVRQTIQSTTFTGVTIKTLDDKTINWVDSTPEQSDKPTLYYGDEMELTWTPPEDQVAGGFTNITFIWCKKDSVQCTSSYTASVGAVNNTEVSHKFVVPTLASVSIFESFVRFRIVSTNEAGVEIAASAYTSAYTYRSDILSKAAKGALTVVIVFCCVAVALALAVGIYAFARWYKKKQRGRHFSSAYVWRKR